MDRRLNVVFGAMCALLCGLCLAKEALGQALPDGKGKAEFVHNCTACHRADMVTAAKKTPDEWKKNVFEMAARGTDGSKEDLDNVVVYLVAHYAADTSGQAAATPSTAPSSTSAGQAALTAAELENITGVIAENGCLICHRIEKQGAYTGPSLNGVGARRTPDQIRTAIVHPHPTLDPKNYLAKLTTADGKTIVARIVSQDDHAVRIIDASGAIVTYAKPELREFTVVDTNPMLSYEKRIAPEDLNSLVRYLGSLPSVDESTQK